MKDQIRGNAPKLTLWLSWVYQRLHLFQHFSSHSFNHVKHLLVFKLKNAKLWTEVVYFPVSKVNDPVLQKSYILFCFSKVRFNIVAKILNWVIQNKGSSPFFVSRVILLWLFSFTTFLFFSCLLQVKITLCFDDQLHEAAKPKDF